MFEELRAKFDTSDLNAVIDGLPSQLTRAWEFTDVKFSVPVSRVYVFGMGGSALPADLVKNIVANMNTTTDFEIEVVRDYQLPRNFSEKSGGIFISFSGNTEETISSLEEALNKGFKNLLVMATGGQLLEIATINHLPYVQIPNDCLQPRMGYGYFIGGLLKVLHLSGLLPDLKAELDHTVQTLTAMNEEIQTFAQNLATKLEKQIPVVYAPDGWKYLAMVVKINFNENTKIQSFWNFFPELNHNEMIGYSNLLGNYHLIIFDDPGAHPRIRKRLNVFTDLMKDKLPITTISMLTTGPITKLFHSLLIGLWTSYFLALKLETDPTPVAMVEEFKKRLNQ